MPDGIMVAWGQSTSCFTIADGVSTCPYFSASPVRACLHADRPWSVMDNVDPTCFLPTEMLSNTAPTSGRMRPPLVGSVASLESLREHLQWAIELEHATIPPYLCALYSMDPGCNLEAAELVSSVLFEEMLHMTLAANLLNAVGGRPRIDIPRMLPGYPRPLPHGDRSFEIPLLRFSPEALQIFLRIEQPSPIGPRPEGDVRDDWSVL
jgi:Ferritin-like